MPPAPACHPDCQVPGPSLSHGACPSSAAGQLESMRVRTEERMKIEHSASRCALSPSGRDGQEGLGGDEGVGLSPCARRMRLSGRCAEADRLLIALAPRTGLGDAFFLSYDL